MVQLASKLPSRSWNYRGRDISPLEGPMPRQYNARVQVTCLTCSTSFSVIPSNLRKGLGKYCSQLCERADRKRVRKPAEQRFWPKVDRRSADECWPWLGSKWQNGYGMFLSPEQRIVKAHRYSLSLALGRPIAEGMLVLHSCDNPPCVNPNHLREGTAQMNADDMVQRGRSTTGDRNGMRLHPTSTLKGTMHSQAKLTEGVVQDIRSRYLSGQISQAQLAMEYEVSQQVISSVVRHATWKHVA